jgi:hypothetical protein
MVGVFALAYGMSLCITYSPGAEAFRRFQNVNLLTMTLVAATTATLASGLPANRWVHKPAPRWLLIALAGIGVAELFAILG